MSSATVQFIKNQKTSVVVGLILAPLILAAFQWHPRVVDTWRLASVRHPEPFSELYFAEPHNLPKKLVPGQNTTLDFVIVNHEAAPYQYQYQVVLIKQGKATPQSAGEVTLSDGHRTTQTVTIPPQQPGEQLQVEIRLPRKQQQIRFATEVAS